MTSSTPAVEVAPEALCVRCARPAESGAAALATVAQLNGLPIDAAEIAPVVGLPAVTELADLVVASRLLGFDSVPLEGGYDELPEVPRPNLVLFKDGRFVVLYQIDASSARIGDPITSVRTMSRDAFVAEWTGDSPAASRSRWSAPPRRRWCVIRCAKTLVVIAHP